MDNEILRDILQEIFGRTLLDTILDFATLGLSVVSIAVAIWVACIYRKQSRIFKQQTEINKIQLEMYKEEVIAKKFSYLPRFIVHGVISGSDGSYVLREIHVRILSDSIVQHFDSLKISVNDKSLPLKFRNVYSDKKYSWEGVENLKVEEFKGDYQVDFILVMKTSNLDEFTETYTAYLTKGYNGFNNDLQRVEGSLKLSNDKRDKQ